jgi:hypothetical protein
MATSTTYAPEKKKVVKRIMALRKKGLGYPAIARELNEAGIAPFGGGRAWYGPTVRHVCIRVAGSAAASMKVAGTKPPTSKK